MYSSTLLFALMRKLLAPCGALLLTVGVILPLHAQQITLHDADPVAEGDSESVIMTFGVGLDVASSETITVQYASLDNTSATPNRDFSPVQGTITFAPGETWKGIQVQILGDVLNENAEEVKVRLSNPTNASIYIGEAVGVIVDTDDVKLGVASARVLESAGQATTTINLNMPLQFEISVDWRTRPNQATEADFEPTTGTATFPPGSTSQVVTVKIKPDTLEEGDESFYVEMTALSHPGIGLENVRALITITDVQVPLFSIADAAAFESDNGSSTTVELTITLSEPMSENAAVIYRTADGTAVAGSDYVAAQQTLTFPPGTTERTIQITILDDEEREDEYFYVRLPQSSANTSIVDDEALVTISDNDSGSLTLVIAESSVNEGQTITGVVRRNGTGDLLEVQLSSSDPQEAAVPAATRIRAGESTGSFSITGIQDDMLDGDNEVQITASAEAYGDSNTVTITVRNADNTRNVVYSYSVRGGEYGSSGSQYIADGYMVFDLNTERIVTVAKLRNGQDISRSWLGGNGMFYTGDIGPADLWFISDGGVTSVAPSATVTDYRYSWMYGSLVPKVPIGGRGVGDITGSLTGQMRFGETTGSTTLGMATLSGRIRLVETRAYNAGNTAFPDVVQDLADKVGVPSPLVGSSESPAPAAASGPRIAEADATVIYRIGVSGIRAGNNGVPRFSYGGFMVADYATQNAALLLTSGHTYERVDLNDAEEIFYGISLARGYGVIGFNDNRVENRNRFMWALGSNVSHPLNTGTTQQVPFRLNGGWWGHDEADNGRGVFTLGTIVCVIHVDTLAVADTSLEAAISFVLTNHLSSYTEGDVY